MLDIRKEGFFAVTLIVIDEIKRKMVKTKIFGIFNRLNSFFGAMRSIECFELGGIETLNAKADPVDTQYHHPA